MSRGVLTFLPSSRYLDTSPSLVLPALAYSGIIVFLGSAQVTVVDRKFLFNAAFARMCCTSILEHFSVCCFTPVDNADILRWFA